jgi:mannose-6-phosphate isomerase-like protein (cupin superfamily)
MPVTRAADAPTFTLPGFRFTGLTAPSRGASEICTWHLHIEPKTASGEPHWLDHEEVFILLEGSMSAVINDEQVTLAAGDALMVPAQARLQVSNPGEQPAHALVCVPAGMRAFTEGQEIGTPPWAQ